MRRWRIVRGLVRWSIVALGAGILALALNHAAVVCAVWFKYYPLPAELARRYSHIYPSVSNLSIVVGACAIGAVLIICALRAK